jgi:hypothetical protein
LLSLSLVAGLAVSLAACADQGITGPTAQVSAKRDKGRTPPLLVCPVHRTQEASAVIGPAGGTLAVGRSVMVVPQGAVSEPTEFTMTIPKSQYLEVEIDAAGYDHYLFDAPVSITLDYTRCKGQKFQDAPLSAWYIDSGSKEPLAEMAGVDERPSRLLTFWTDHLSGYAAAYRSSRTDRD